MVGASIAALATPCFALTINGGTATPHLSIDRRRPVAVPYRDVDSVQKGKVSRRVGSAIGGCLQTVKFVSTSEKPELARLLSLRLPPLGSCGSWWRPWGLLRRRRRCGSSQRRETVKLLLAPSSAGSTLLRGRKILSTQHPVHTAGKLRESRVDLCEIRDRRLGNHVAEWNPSAYRFVADSVLAETELSRRRARRVIAAATAAGSFHRRTKCADGSPHHTRLLRTLYRGERWGWRKAEEGCGSGMLATTTTTSVKSHAPEETVYTGPQATPPKRITLRHVLAKYRRKEPITMVTAYDYPSAVHVDMAGIDILLVGDSVGMVVHGHDSTLPVTLEDMLLHCRAVARGARRPLLVGDLPFGSYEQSPEQAVASATRLLKEGFVDAVKLEGGSQSRVAAVRAVVDAGIAVMGHVGLTPQAISILGGFRPQGKKAEGAVKILEQALALKEAGCFAVVLECLPAPVAAAITATSGIPTIGIGAGPHTSGQVLVYHDLLGMIQHPHHAKVTPKFCKRYAEVGKVIQGALAEFRAEVLTNQFPSETYSPYVMEEEEMAAFEKALSDRGIQAEEYLNLSSSHDDRHSQQHRDEDGGHQSNGGAAEYESSQGVLTPGD